MAIKGVIGIAIGIVSICGGLHLAWLAAHHAKGGSLAQALDLTLAGAAVLVGVAVLENAAG